MDFGFEYGGGAPGANPQDKGNVEGQKFDENGNPIKDINDGGDNGNGNNGNGDGGNNGDGGDNGNGSGNGNGGDGKGNDNNNDGGNNGGEGDDKEIELEEGMTIEVPTENGTVLYTVDKDKNLIDKDGNIFKEAKDVKDFLKDFSTGDDTDPEKVTIENIQNSIGIEVTDEKGEKIVYDDSLEGIQNYVKDVIEHQKKEVAEASVNALFEKYPVLSEFLNYYVANGNSYDGFGQAPDRTNVTLDENNETQLEGIIRTAWKEQKRTGDVDGYINWLKSSGTLYATAKTELEGLQAADKARKETYEREAQEAEAKRVKEVTEYWNGVNNVIKSRKIAGYTIPESIIIQKDGHKVANTPNDFFNYLYQVDDKGHSRYENDLLKLTPEQRRDDEILRAYLMFTGGSYADLVKMAINEDKIKTIRLQAKNAEKRTIRVMPKTKNNNSSQDFGY